MSLSNAGKQFYIKGDSTCVRYTLWGCGQVWLQKWVLSMHWWQGKKAPGLRQRADTAPRWWLKLTAEVSSGMWKAGECGSYGHSQRLATWHDIHSLVPECRICLCTGFFCSRTAPQCCSSSWWLASSMDRSFWASNSNSLVHLLLSLVLFSTASRNGSWTTREFFSFLELRTPGSRGCVDEAEASGFCLLFQIFLQLVLPTAAFRAVSH